MNTALLIISHGSRRAASNEEVFALTDSIRARSVGMAVECAFLEITGPTIQQTVDQLAAAGAKNMLVFPHFLAAGAHVTTDIPREIETARTRHPDISFRLLPHLGSLPELPDLILKHVETAS